MLKKNEAGNEQQNPSLIHRAKHFKPGEEGNRKITPEGNNNTLNPKVWNLSSAFSSKL